MLTHTYRHTTGHTHNNKKKHKRTHTCSGSARLTRGSGRREEKKTKKTNSLGHQIDSPRLVCGWDDGERKERGGSVRMDNATERKERERENVLRNRCDHCPLPPLSKARCRCDRTRLRVTDGQFCLLLSSTTQISDRSCSPLNR